MLKSRFMQQLDLESDDAKVFVRGLKAVESLSENVLTELARGVPEIHRLRTSHQVQQFIERQTSALGMPRGQAGQVVDHVMFPLLRAFAGKFGEAVKTDSPQALIEDLVGLGLISEGEKAKFLKMVTLLKTEIAPIYEKQQRLQSHAAGVLPSWKGIGATVELRAVLGSNYKMGDDVENYKPACVDIVPVASISLRVDQGEPERFYFQLTEHELKDLIDNLKATLKDLQEFKQHVTFSQETKRL